MDGAPDAHGAAGVAAACTYLALVEEEPVESARVGSGTAFPAFSLHFTQRLSFASV